MKRTESSEAVQLNNELIRQAFILYDKQEAQIAHEKYMEHAGVLPEFSEEFLMKMKKLSRKQKRPRVLRSRVFKAVVIIAAVLALLSVLAFGVTGIREWLFGLFLEPTQNASYVLYSDESELRETIETYYEPKYIPEGYKKSDEKTSMSATINIFVLDQISNSGSNDGINRNIHIIQQTRNVVSTIDTENADIEHLKLRGTDAIYIHKTYAENVYGLSLTWFEDGYIFEVSLLNTGDYEMLLAIAESVAPVE